MVKGDFGKKQIGSGFSCDEIFWDFDAVFGSKNIEQRTNTQEKKVDDDKDSGKSKHVFLCFANVNTAQVFLHQILVESHHCDCYKNAAQNLLDKMKF